MTELEIMSGRHNTNRAPNDHPTDTSSDSNSTGDDSTGESTTVTETHRREWRRWAIEAVSSGTAGVVPLERLVDTIAEREPDEMGRSTIQTALTDQILPTLEREPGVEYDPDRQLVTNYGY